MTENRPSEGTARERWKQERTTFQRVYDVLVGTHDPASAKQFADWADCSENGARQALSQLSEMGIADRSETRPTTYRRNPSYFRWKRVEQLAREHAPAELRTRVDELLDEDQRFQERYGVPDPDAVVESEGPDTDHESVHERWDELAEWRTVRRDIATLERAVRRAESMRDDRARA